MNETSWTHLGIVAVPALMIMGFWLDVRRQRRDESKENAARHEENKVRLTRIETKVEPIWTWWNRNGGPDH